MKPELLAAFPGAEGMLKRYPGHKLYYTHEYPEDAFGRKAFPYEIEGRVRSQQVLKRPVESLFIRAPRTVAMLHDQAIDTIDQLMRMGVEDLHACIRPYVSLDGLAQRVEFNIITRALYGPEDRFMSRLFGLERRDVLIPPGDEPKRAEAIETTLNSLLIGQGGAEIMRRHVDLYFGFTTGEPASPEDISNIPKHTLVIVRRDIQTVMTMFRGDEELLRTFLPT